MSLTRLKSVVIPPGANYASLLKGVERNIRSWEIVENIIKERFIKTENGTSASNIIFVQR